MTHFARALGAARSGNPDAATPDITRLGELAAKLAAIPDPYWAEQVGIQQRIARAWQRYAQGQRDQGITELSAAADAEDQTDKSAISPGPLAPARELLGYMLLEAGRHQDALAAFEATMKKEPNRFRGAYGAARAAELAGDRSKAAAYYTQLLAIAKEADTERPEIAAAKKYVAASGR
jgi:tetratricopeptide (TPR) repeat protein